MARRRRKARRWVETLLLLAGLAALDVWIWANAATGLFQNWQNWVFDREVHGQPAPVSAYLAEKSGEIASQLKGWLGFPAASPARSAPPAAPPLSRPPAVRNDGLVGRLTIPRLHLTAMVREGVGEDTLSLALGHIPGTALPGQKGNVGVAGHRDTLFRALRKIRKNDTIHFETLAGNYTYQVESTKVVKPENVSVLRANQYPELTLVTCYPFYYVGSAPDRFIVKARQEDRGAPSAASASVEEPAVRDQRVSSRSKPSLARRNRRARRRRAIHGPRLAYAARHH